MKYPDRNPCWTEISLRFCDRVRLMMTRGRYLCFALVNLLAFQYELKYDLGGTGMKLVTIEVATGTSIGAYLLSGAIFLIQAAGNLMFIVDRLQHRGTAAALDGLSTNARAEGGGGGPGAGGGGGGEILLS
eukprot:COSAG01_NODE_5158_length_4445_cov_12.910953_5_plen_131_part_00